LPRQPILSYSPNSNTVANALVVSVLATRWMVSLTTRQRASGLARANTPEKSGCIWQGVEREREDTIEGRSEERERRGEGGYRGR